VVLTTGTRLGPYEILSELGVGGMGEVYRARDTKLNRDVALKVIAPAYALEPDRLARFRREAQVLASLNHPHIGAIYGFEDSGETHALVLELIEGETLADRIARGPLPIEDALTITRQICEALEAAHEQAIIHRDLKPANIKITPDGVVKVLDFGLAKLAEPEAVAGRADLTASPTLTSPAVRTGVGVLLGTAAYMSPEQAKGREADKRSDIWAFGAILYEMLTARRAFEGDDIADTLAAVLKQEPDWTLLPGNLPAATRTLIQRCLVKDRRRRIADIAVAQFVLAQQTDLAQESAAPIVKDGTARKRALAIAAAVLLTAVVAGVVTWALMPAAAPPALVKFAISLSEGQQFSEVSNQVVAISPDGNLIVYAANGQLYRRLIGDQEAHAIPGGQVAALLDHPVFSPDGSTLAFYSASDSTLKRLPISGGTPITITPVRLNPNGMSWDEDGIVFDERSNQIFRVSPNGGAPEELVRVGANEQVLAPQILPGGDAVLFSLRPYTEAGWDTAQVVVQSLTSAERKTVVTGGTDGRYLPSGHLVYAVAGSLFAVGFDPLRHTTVGAAVPILTGVRRAFGTAMFSVSDTGSLVYVPGPATTSNLLTLVRSDRNGVSVPLALPPRNYAHPRVSRDGSTLAVGIDEGQEANIWIYELAGKSAMRKLTSAGRNRYPVWSGDGRKIAFQSDQHGDLGIFWQPADGTAAAVRLTTPSQGAAHVPESWSPDGKHLLFTEFKDSTYVLFSLSVDDLTIAPFGKVQSTQPMSAGFSPDGRWVTYASAVQFGGVASPDRGVFIQPFPATGAKYPVPKTRIDFHPVWSLDGKEIVYVSAAAQPFVALSVRTQPGVSFGSPTAVSQTVPRPGLTSGDLRGRGYDLLPGGEFLTLAPVAVPEITATAQRPEIRVVLNWREELKRFVPTK